MCQLSTLLIEYLVLTIVYPARGSLLCKEKSCSCCRSGTCADLSQHAFPCKGCIDGYTGPKCYEPCPANCDNCSQLFYENEFERECYQCKRGFYNGKYKDIDSYPLQQDCSLACVENCLMCTSYYGCTECKPQYYRTKYFKECKKCPVDCVQCTSGSECLACEDGHFWNGVECVICEAGYFGKNCSGRCPDTCKVNKCHKSTGICIFCDDGYFKNQDEICLKCPEHCNYCLSNELCFSCTAGYMGDKCQYKCSNCKPGTACDMFTGYCLDSCRNGISGEDCNLLCHSNCFLCERKNPNTCGRCASDRYGLDMNCINQCSVNCINDTCGDRDGKCTHGCENGYWGDKCDHNCSKDCLDRNCKISDGSCLKICNSTDNPDTYTCVCPTNCECDTDNHCARCVNTYGLLCDTPCNKGCVDTICDRKTGECLLGCLPGLSGSHCSTGPEDDMKTSSVLTVVASTLSLVGVLALCAIVCYILIRKGHLPFVSFRIQLLREWAQHRIANAVDIDSGRT